MKKILIISYMFPPISGGGTQRPLKFIKYLPAYGIQPVVFCPEKAAWKAYDYKNLELPFLKDVPIYRCGIRRLQRYYNLRYTKGIRWHPIYYLLALKYLYFLDFFSAWYFECRRKAAEIVLKEKVDCVFTTSPPHSTHLFGLYLKKKLNIPWVMDIRDAMAIDPNKAKTSIFKLQETIDYLYEKKFYSKADAIVSVSDPIVSSIRKRHPRLNLNSKTYTIFNGYDDEDFNSIRKTEEIGRVFSITYTGSFMGRQTPYFFLQAVRLLIEQKAIEAPDILIRFVGHFSDKTLALFNKYQSYFPLEVHDFQPYFEALQYQVNSLLLLLIVNIEEGEGGSQTMTGKFFEYLGAKRPIFAMVPEGPLKEIILKGRFGILAPIKDVTEIAEKFKALYDQWKKNGHIPYCPDLALRSRFARKPLTGKLASIMHDILN